MLIVMPSFGALDKEWSCYGDVIRKYIYKDYKEMFRPAGGALQYPFMTPGSAAYPDVLWNWDSWLSNIALRQILTDNGSDTDRNEAQEYEWGCVLNFLSFVGGDSWMPISVGRNTNVQSLKPANVYEANMHKPCLAQHVAFLVRENDGDAKWLRERFSQMQYYLDGYKNRFKHATTGLFFW